MVGVEEGREFRFRGDLYSQESTFPLVTSSIIVRHKAAVKKRHIGRYTACVSDSIAAIHPLSEQPG